MIPGGSASSAELAIRFVLSNPNVTCALSGMGSLDMVKENIKVASTAGALSPQEILNVKASIKEKQALADLYCTGCNYCMPCPNGVDIPGNFEIMNLNRVYGLTNTAKGRYKGMTDRNKKGKYPASACTECGNCEPLCPQHIEIIRQLKETHEVLG
jgi:predicted aldo/keto reductase-like oxidoreductase